jgi:hypothetical protein
MPSDLLVMKIVEKSKDNGKRLCSYVFYDCNTELFGVRCRFRKSKKGNDCNCSYYVEDKESLIDFLLHFIDYPGDTGIFLINISTNENNSDNITFEYLNEHDVKDNEISWYMYNYKNNDSDNDDDTDSVSSRSIVGIDDDENFVKNAIRDLTNIMENVYNCY